MFKSLKVDRKSVSGTLMNHIKELIHGGHLVPGSKLPSEREMAAQINVSRNTIREAYKMLAVEGYVVIKQGNGVFVADQEAQIRKLTSSFFVKNDRVLDLFSIRKILEVEAAKWAAEKAKPQDIRDLSNILHDMKTLLKERNFEEILSKDQEFHLHIARMTENKILLRIMLSLIDTINEVQTDSVEIPGRVRQSIKEHAAILKAIQEKDSLSAGMFMLEHLTSVERSILDDGLPN